MNKPSWTSDIHGTLVLAGHHLGKPDGFAWIQARQAYCDRGHWDWGTQGLPVYRGAEFLPEPSHYFMRLDTGVLEVGAWLARNMGAPYQGKRLSHLSDPLSLGHEQRSALGYQWEKKDGALHAEFSVEGETVRATISEKETARGPVFLFEVNEGIPTLDGSDCFPRFFMDLDRALDEADTFFVWRLLKIPAETPRFLRDTQKPLGPDLEPVVAHPPVQNPKRLRP